MTVKYKIVSTPPSQYRLKKNRQIQSHREVIQFKSWFFDNFYLCIKESSCSTDGNERGKDHFKLHLTSDVVTKLSDKKTSNAFICITPKISPEYLLKDTIMRRVTKSVGSRFWLIHILNRIDEYNENYQTYFDTTKVKVPVFIQMQVDAYRVLNHDVFGYQLSDGSLGFSFRDKTNLILLSDFQQMYYIRPHRRIFYFKDKASAPGWLRGKLAHVSVFENIARTYSQTEPEEVMYDIPFLVKWLRFINCSVLYFSNGTLEILFHSGRKVVISPFMKPVSISEKGIVSLVSPNDMKLVLLLSKRLFQVWFASSSLRWIIFPVPP